MFETLLKVSLAKSILTVERILLLTLKVSLRQRGKSHQNDVALI
jgi:hypothetical protein